MKRLVGNQRIVRRTIKVEDIEIRPERAKEDVWDRIRKYEQNISDAYPMGFLIEEISKGWDPACRMTTLHREDIAHSPFLVLEGDSGEYILDNGRHRYMALNILGIKEVEAFVLVQDGFKDVSETKLRKLVGEIESRRKGGQQYQSLELPYGIEWLSRDNTRDLFYTPFSYKKWVGSSVLDVATHIGAFALEAKRCGAERVVGFDLDKKLIALGEELGEILGLEVKLYYCDFWDFPLWGKEKFDIVLAHQCLYHFNTAHRCRHAGQHTIDEMLDLVTGAAKEVFVSYTFIHKNGSKDRVSPEGWRPTEDEALEDMKTRGFEDVFIEDFKPSSSKKFLVAHRSIFYNIPPKKSGYTPPTREEIERWRKKKLKVDNV